MVLLLVADETPALFISRLQVLFNGPDHALTIFRDWKGDTLQIHGRCPALPRICRASDRRGASGTLDLSAAVRHKVPTSEDCPCIS